jgi:hypothetical protein
MNNLLHNLPSQRVRSILEGFRNPAFQLCADLGIIPGDVSSDAPLLNWEVAALELFQQSTVARVVKKYGL